jgi:hypothetical protein
MSLTGVTGASANHKYHMIKFTLFRQLLEGGWATTATQHTKIMPATVREVMHTMQGLVKDFNTWLRDQGHAPGVVKVGSPTGSGYYHAQDPEHKEYGDVDLQMIAPNTSGASHASYASAWNQLWDEWVARDAPPQVLPEYSTPGHPILQLSSGGVVQVDFMWHEPAHETWGLARSVPPRGLKGLLNGNMFSVLGHMLNMSLQHAGAQVKVDASGSPVAFNKRKGVTLQTITHDPHNLFVHLLQYLTQKPDSNLLIPSLLAENPGVRWPNPDIQVMVRGIKGLAQGISSNHAWGQGLLEPYKNEQDFLDKFWHKYEQKAQSEMASPKRAKAETPEAQARAKRDIDSIAQGLAKIKHMWNS